MKSDKQLMDEAASACHLPSNQFPIPPYMGILAHSSDGRKITGCTGCSWHQVLGWLEQHVQSLKWGPLTVYLTSSPRGEVDALESRLLSLAIEGLVMGRDWTEIRSASTAQLRSAGVKVRKYRSDRPFRRANQRFLNTLAAGRSWVFLKSASSLDGRIATRTGHSQWITSEEARALGRTWRAQVDGICVGVETVLSDNPKLTSRIPGSSNPARIIFDSRLRTPAEAIVVKTATQTRTIIVTTRQSEKSSRERLAELGVEIVLARARRGKVDLAQALAKLHELGIQTLMAEGGAALHGSFVDAKLVDRIAAFLAPIIIGGHAAKTGIGGLGIANLSDALVLSPLECTPVGSDLLVLADVQHKL